MGISIFLDKDKNLYTKVNSLNYKAENNFEKLQIYIPLTYNNNPIDEYTIQLNVINEDNVGDVLTLSNPIIDKNKYKYEVPVPLRWTYKEGRIGLWLKFLKDDNVVGLTNEIFLDIKDSKEIVEYIPEQSLSLLDEWTLQMQNLDTDVQNGLDKLESMSKNPSYVGDTGNWFIWDYDTQQYIDSGIKADIGYTVEIKDDYWILFGKEE